MTDAAGGDLPPAEERKDDNAAATECAEEVDQAVAASSSSSPPAAVAPGGDTPPGGGVNPEERLNGGLADKEKGSKAYAEGDYENAIEAWCMARGMMKHILERGMFDDDPEKTEFVRNTLKAIYLNLSQGYLKNKEFYQAVQQANMVLEEDPQNTKALYRKASAQIHGSLFEEARKTLQLLLEAEPGNAAALQLLQEVARKEKTSAKSGKKAARKIFANIGHDHRVEPPANEKLSWWLRCRWCSRRKKD